MAGQMTLVEPLVVGDRIQVEIEVCDESGNTLAECEQYTGRGEGPFQNEECVDLFTSFFCRRAWPTHSITTYTLPNGAWQGRVRWHVTVLVLVECVAA